MDDRLDALLKGILGSEGGAESEKSAGSDPSGGSPAGPGAAGLFEGIDPKILFGLMDLLGEWSAEDDASRLIVSLKPFMSEERAGRVDEAIGMMRLARAAKSAFRLFGQGGKEA